MIIQNKRTVASILFVLISFVCFAQSGPTPPPPGPPPPVGLPIDDYLPFLFLVGMLLGVKQLLKRKPSHS